MGDKTKIEWTDATWNPVTGCLIVSSGCKYCYAERDFHHPYPRREFTDVRTHPERLEQPLRWRKSRRIFVNSMSDLFHDRVGDGFIEAVVGAMWAARQHTFQILTKRPERARQFLRVKTLEMCLAELRGWLAALPSSVSTDQYDSARLNGSWPLPNVWLGVSMEDQETADQRVPVLLETPAALRFVSYEPALGRIDFSRLLARTTYLPAEMSGEALDAGSAGEEIPGVDWIICGGESGLEARPAHPDWFRSVRDQCQAARVPFFFKQWGEWAPYRGDFSGLHLSSSRPAHRMIEAQLMERRGK